MTKAELHWAELVTEGQEHMTRLLSSIATHCGPEAAPLAEACATHRLEMAAAMAELRREVEFRGKILDSLQEFDKAMSLR